MANIKLVITERVSSLLVVARLVQHINAPGRACIVVGI